MSSRFTRPALAGLLTAVIAAVLPAVASADTINLAPDNLQAAGSPAITTTYAFAPNANDTPKTVVTALPAGDLANLNANPSCLVGALQQTGACQVGTGSVTFNNTPATTQQGSVYLGPAQAASDVSGLYFVVPGSPSGPQYIGVTVRSADGGLNLTESLPDTALGGADLTGQTTTFNPTVNGQPFTRLPSSCGAAVTNLSVSYYGGTPASTGSSTFTPTGCAALPYAPRLSGTVTRDAGDSGATIVTDVTQNANESTSQSIVLNLPASISPNLTAAGACLTPTGCTVGSAAASSPLVPAGGPLDHGVVTLSGTFFAPALTIAFPAPIPVSLVGTINLATNSVTFSNVPDIPLTSLALTITGPGGGKAFTTTCQPANVQVAFTPRSGGPAQSVSVPITYQNCPSAIPGGGQVAVGKPGLSSPSLAGLAGGHPKLHFTTRAGNNAPGISAAAIRLPSGLSFSRKAISSVKQCKGKGKKRKCTKTLKVKGLATGAKLSSAKLSGGRLLLRLKKPVRSATLTLSAPLLVESPALRKRVRSHKVKSLSIPVTLTDAHGGRTPLVLKLKP